MALNDNLNANKLRERADSQLTRLPKLKEWVDSKDERRAFIVEFAGMPKAGKSSAIETTRHFFAHGLKVATIRTTDADKPRSSPYKIYTPAEGVSLRTPGYLKSSKIDYNSWAGAYALQELLQAAHDHFHDLVILDRGPWDASCWLEYFIEQKNLEGNIGKKDASKLISFFRLNHWMVQADLHIVLTVDPLKAAKREMSERLIDHRGPASDVELMKAMKTIYETEFSKLQQCKTVSCPHVGKKAALLIDTSEIDSKEVALKVIEGIFDVVDAKLNATELSERDLWEQMSPWLVTARKSELKLVKDYLPHFITRANASLPFQKQQIKAEIDRMFEPAKLSPQMELYELAANRLEAAVVIKRLESMLSIVPLKSHD